VTNQARMVQRNASSSLTKYWMKTLANFSSSVYVSKSRNYVTPIETLERDTSER
jgi:hypothetical protein